MNKYTNVVNITEDKVEIVICPTRAIKYQEFINSLECAVNTTLPLTITLGETYDTFLNRLGYTLLKHLPMETKKLMDLMEIGMADGVTRSTIAQMFLNHAIPDTFYIRDDINMKIIKIESGDVDAD